MYLQWFFSQLYTAAPPWFERRGTLGNKYWPMIGTPSSDTSAGQSGTARAIPKAEKDWRRRKPQAARKLLSVHGITTWIMITCLAVAPSESNDGLKPQIRENCARCHFAGRSIVWRAVLIAQNGAVCKNRNSVSMSESNPPGTLRFWWRIDLQEQAGDPKRKSCNT